MNLPRVLGVRRFEKAVGEWALVCTDEWGSG